MDSCLSDTCAHNEKALFSTYDHVHHDDIIVTMATITKQATRLVNLSIFTLCESTY